MWLDVGEALACGVCASQGRVPIEVMDDGAQLAGLTGECVSTFATHNAHMQPVKACTSITEPSHCLNQ